MAIRITISRQGRPILVKDLAGLPDRGVSDELTSMFDQLKSRGRLTTAWDYDVSVVHLSSESPRPKVDREEELPSNTVFEPRLATGTVARVADPRPISRPSLQEEGGSTRGAALSPEERVARMVCKLLTVQSIDSEKLKARYAEMIRGLTARGRRSADGEHFEKGLERALARGWVVQRRGLFELTETGVLLAKRSRAQKRRERVF